MKRDMECKDSIEYRVYRIESRKKKKRKIQDSQERGSQEPGEKRQYQVNQLVG